MRLLIVEQVRLRFASGQIGLGEHAQRRDAVPVQFVACDGNPHHKIAHDAIELIVRTAATARPRGIDYEDHFVQIAGLDPVATASLSTTHFHTPLRRTFRRGTQRANATYRRTRPVMAQRFLIGTTPPPDAGYGEHKENMALKSSPFIAGATALQPVAPTRPAAGYIGGKRNLSRRLVTLIGTVPHQTYAEAFVGMGGIFLRRDTRAPAEVINDWSEDVSTFFRILQRHYIAFLDMLRFQLTSRAGFERLIRTDPSTLTDLERSARFLYLQRLAFGGKVAGRHFGVAPQQSARFDVTKLGPLLEAIHERLAGVVIERLRWADFLDRYDRPGTLFYLDPPYYGSEGDYGAGMFDRSEFEAMADRLGRLKGRFILSLNDHPAVRETFARFPMEAVTTTYTLAGLTNAKAAGELIISSLL